MNTFTLYRQSKWLIAALVSCSLMGSAVSYAGEIYLSDAINVKLSRLKTKNRVMQHKKYGEGLDEETKAKLERTQSRKTDCGNVDIGNISASKKKTYGSKKVDVIIVGDVINVGNKC